MTTKSKSILVAPLFPFWLLLVIAFVVLATIAETFYLVKYWFWPEIVKPFFSEQWDNFRYRLGIVTYDEIREAYHWELKDPNSRFYDPKEVEAREIDRSRFLLDIKREAATRELTESWIAAKEGGGIDAFWRPIYLAKQSIETKRKLAEKEGTNK